MSAITICGPNLRDQSKGDFHAHAAGCGDLTRGAAREPEYRNGWTIEAASRREVTEHIYPTDEFEYEYADDGETYESNIHFFPCTAGLLK